MGLVRCVCGYEYRSGNSPAALPTNLSFQPDDGLGSKDHPGAVAILINQKNGERLVWEWERVNSIWGKNFCIFSRRQKKEPKGYGGEEIRKMGS